MRRFVATIDQIPGWQFVLGGIATLAAVKGWWMAAQLTRNPGASELGGLVLLAGSIVLSIFAIRRRQTGVWDAAAQLIVTIAAANMVSYALLIPFLPPGTTDDLLAMVRGGVGETLVGAGLAIPVQAAGLWLSRRFGSHSAVTERRLRVVRNEPGAGPRARADAADATTAGEDGDRPRAFAPRAEPAP